MLKKWRPFWSYDMEKTERFLSDMAAEGKQLSHVNLWLRLFSFQEGNAEKAAFQVVYDKQQSTLPRGIQEAGWTEVLNERNWRFLTNSCDSIQAYPIRAGILKRNKIHSSVATIIALLSGTQAFILLTLLVVVGFLGESSEGNVAALLGYGLPLLPSVILITLAVYATRKLRGFEQKYFNTAIDEAQDDGETIKRWRFGWINAPDTTENWLARMSLKGYHLTRIYGMRFTFTKGEPKQVSYVYDYQWKAAPTYFDIHKGADWQLIFSTPYSFNKSTLWKKEYEVDETKPRLTYDASEEKVLVRKVLMTSVGSVAYTVLLTLYIFWLYNGIYEDHWEVFAKFVVTALVLSISLPVIGLVRSLGYAKRMKGV